MPNLGDYLGQLMAEIALARMQADLESLRIAELYAAHPLLRTLPIPHLRLPEVNLEIPVLIESSEPSRPGETPRGGYRLPGLVERFRSVVRRVLGGVGVELSEAEHRRLRTVLEDRLDVLRLPDEVSIDVRRVADDLTTTTLRHLSGRPAGGRAKPIVLPDNLEQILREAATREFLSARTSSPRLVVRVTSQELREVGPEGATRLRVRITEQGLELTRVEGDAGAQDRLVPE